MKTIYSPHFAGNYEKTIEVRRLGHRDLPASGVSLHISCAQYEPANGDFSISANAARALRDALPEIVGNPVAAVTAPAPKARSHGAQEYKGNTKHRWEDVTSGGHTQRLRVPGGWLYMTSGTTVFVPVPQAVGYAV